jgi:lysophospholipase L1-like esterase
MTMDHDPLTIVAFGDSITLAGRQPEDRRWPEIVRRSLADRLSDREIRVINAGGGGNTSREGLQRIDQDVCSHAPDIVTVQFGGNDATPEPERHVSPGEFRDNLAQIHARVSHGSACRTALLTFPPLIDEWHAWNGHEFFSHDGGINAYIHRYRNAVLDYAAAHSLPVADIHGLLQSAIDRDGPEPYILPDGVHLTEQANGLVAERVTEAILEMEGVG